jgi:protein-disulfide isomerase
MGQSNKQRGAPTNPGQWPVALATLAGIGVLLAMTYSSSQEIRQINDGLDDKLQKIDTRISQLADKVDKLPAQAQQPRRGLDPNKVYTIKTAGSPAKGPANAPITIAEFSDFQ